MDSFPENPLIPDTEQLLQGIQDAAAQELRLHKILGHSVVIFEEGKPVVLAADQIPEEVCAPWPPKQG